MARVSKEKWKIYGNVFDEFTERTLQKIIGQGIIDGIESPIQIGKEANTFTAWTRTGQKRVVKIYRLESCNFNKMYSYIKSDPRFMDIKKQRRQVIFNWVLREFKNLMQARKAGVRVPTPITQVNHVLVLEMIGDKEPSLQLKDDVPENLQELLDDIIENLRLLYHKAGLVHADLSEFNILNYNGRPVFIDMSQSTTVRDMDAMNYLERDIDNIKRFFKKYQFHVDKEDVIKKITAK